MPEVPKPIPMILYCPSCFVQHVDAPDPEAGWTNPPHRSHLCHGCGHVWRPCDELTEGVVAIQTAGAGDSPKALRVKDDDTTDTLHFLYQNHKGEVSHRQVRPVSMIYGCLEPWYPEETWLLEGYDLDKGEPRTFRMDRMWGIQEPTEDRVDYMIETELTGLYKTAAHPDPNLFPPFIPKALLERVHAESRTFLAQNLEQYGKDLKATMAWGLLMGASHPIRRAISAAREDLFLAMSRRALAHQLETLNRLIGNPP